MPAIDFISRLLAKVPHERMTMAEALEHEWLAGPSSQRSESQPVALGGDSTWEINSFDNDSDQEPDLFTNEDARSDDEGRWTRPGTVSGTNMESALDSRIDSGLSDESFSQPMGNLRLNTPAVRNNGRVQLSVVPAISPEQDGSPPSPPLTNDAIDIDPPQPMQPHQDNALPTPGASEPGNKRKLDGMTAFSSGSLSPPPATEKENSPQTPVKGAVNGARDGTPSTNETTGSKTKRGKDSSTPNAPPKRKTRMSLAAQETAKPNAANGAGSASARRSTRPRKSTRLQ